MRWSAVGIRGRLFGGTRPSWAIDVPGTSLLLGRRVLDEFCGPPADDMRNGWGELATGECPAGEPNVWMATVETDDL